jgi:DNA-binding beta-propeller fold protein YncE
VSALYGIDPMTSPVPAAVVGALGGGATALAFDGSRIWSANTSTVSIATLAGSTPYPVATGTGAFSMPTGLLFDGTDIWLTDRAANKLHRLDAFGGILQSVSVGVSPRQPVFDGANLWVPNAGDDSITVVQASTGAIVATIAANPTNQLSAPTSAAFDGERVLVTNTSGNSVTIFRASDFAVLSTVDTGPLTAPQGACSDGIGFWVLLPGTSSVLRL